MSKSTDSSSHTQLAAELMGEIGADDWFVGCAQAEEMMVAAFVKVRRETIEECARRCEMIDEYMGPRFCADQIRKLSSPSSRNGSGEK